jgi:Domain of unknown function (DUF6484)
MRSPETTVAVFPIGAAEVLSDAAPAQLVTIVAIADDGSPLVLVDTGGPVVTARLAVHTTVERVQLAIAHRHQAVVVFERGDRSRPLILGFLEPLDMNPSSSEAASANAAEATEVEPPRDAPAAQADDPAVMPSIEADVDGRRVRLTAQDEIVLQCGSASVTLRRNGRVVIRGTYVETHSDGTNRIKGGQVHIN